MATKLSRENLHSLEEYSSMRAEFRPRAIAHRKLRRIAVNENAALYFEDFLTMQYQAQEILRAERVFEADAIEEEIETYNPLIPDGSNWKATFMLEYREESERRAALAGLIGIEDKVYVQVGDAERVWAIADEDLERNNEEKTSSVHFMRFELTPAMVAAAHAGADIRVGIEHPNLTAEVRLADAPRASLVADLDPPH